MDDDGCDCRPDRTPIWAALIGVVGALIPAWLDHRDRQRERDDQRMFLLGRASREDDAEDEDD